MRFWTHGKKPTDLLTIKNNEKYKWTLTVITSGQEDERLDRLVFLIISTNVYLGHLQSCTN